MSITALVYFTSLLNLFRGLNTDRMGSERSRRRDLNCLKEGEKGEQV